MANSAAEPIGEASAALKELLGLLTSWGATQTNHQNAHGCASCAVLSGFALCGLALWREVDWLYVCGFVSIGGGILTGVVLENKPKRPAEIDRLVRAVANAYPEEIGSRGGPKLLYEGEHVRKLIEAEKNKCPTCARWDAIRIVERLKLDSRLSTGQQLRIDKTRCTDRQDTRYGTVIAETERLETVTYAETLLVDVRACQFCNRKWKSQPYWSCS